MHITSPCRCTPVHAASPNSMFFPLLGRRATAAGQRRPVMASRAVRRSTLSSVAELCTIVEETGEEVSGPYRPGGAPAQKPSATGSLGCRRFVPWRVVRELAASLKVALRRSNLDILSALVRSVTGLHGPATSALSQGKAPTQRLPQLAVGHGLRECSRCAMLTSSVSM
jgi:hypothetical protein